MDQATLGRLESQLKRRSEVERQLAQLYTRRAGKEKHISRIVPEYSEDWENDPSVKESDKKGDEKMASAEMVLLVAEKRDLFRGEKQYREAIGRHIEELGKGPADGEWIESQCADFQRISAMAERLDEAALLGQRIIRQSGHIKRCMDQALKFRFGSSGLSEPLRTALRAVGEIEPMIVSFYTLIGEPSFKMDLREKIKYCQIGGADWVWETFDLDIIGLITRLFHRPDMKRFSEVDVELLDIRFRVYNAMSRVAVKRAELIAELRELARKAGLITDDESV